MLVKEVLASMQAFVLVSLLLLLSGSSAQASFFNYISEAVLGFFADVYRKDGFIVANFYARLLSEIRNTVRGGGFFSVQCFKSITVPIVKTFCFVFVENH